MSQLLGTLRNYFVQLEAVRHINIASCNINLDTLPTTATGARDGDVWVDGNILKVAGLAGGGGTVTTTNSVTFNNSGSGAASGTAFNGASAVTVSYNTVGAAAASHTHSYLPLTGGILTGNLRVETASYPMIQVRDTALAADARQWALYVAPTDGGVRLAPTTDAGSAASGLNIDRSGNASLPRLQLTAGDDVSLASTLHALQIGATNGGNIVADSNEIMARNNGAATTLYLNNEGGAVQIGGVLNVNPVGVGTFIQGTAPAASNAALYFSRDAGYALSLVFRTAASNRWTFHVTSTAESGSNAGSNFSLYRYDDAGTIIDAPFAVTRSTGVVAFTQTPTVGGTAVSLVGHTHSYLPLSGGTITGGVTLDQGAHLNRGGNVTSSGWQQVYGLSASKAIVLDSGLAGAGRYALTGATSDGNWYFARSQLDNGTTAPTYAFWITPAGNITFNQNINGAVGIVPGNSQTGLTVLGSANGGDGYYALALQQGSAQNYGKVLKIATATTPTSGTDGPQIHFIREGVYEWGFGIGSSTNSMVMYAGGNTSGFGTERFNFGTSGNFRATGDELFVSNTSTGDEKRLRMSHSARDIYYYLASSGTSQAGLWDSTGGFNRWYTDTSGNFVAYGNVTAYSDERLKSHFYDSTVSLEQMLTLKPEGFLRTDSGQWQVGVRAQALQKVLPAAVVPDAQGYLTANYGAAAMVLILSLAREVAELKRQLNGKESHGN
jgi:hypothetical protein